MYGLVSYDLTGDTASAASGADAQYGRSGTPKPINPDFENLSKHWATLSPTGIRADDYKPSLTPPPCPDFTSGAWAVSPDAQLPTIGAKAEMNSDSSNASATSSAAATATSEVQPGQSGDAAAANAAESSSSAGESAEASPTSGASLRAKSPLVSALPLGFAGCVWVSVALMVGVLIVL